MWTKLKKFYKRNKAFIYVITILSSLAILYYFFGLNLLSILGTMLVGFVGNVPLAGPIMVRAMMLPVFLSINIFLYLIKLLRIKKGKRVEFNKEAVSIVITFGILVGYILAKIF
ncbi:MAG: hypothetical protein V1872_12550 [bacterium]